MTYTTVEKSNGSAIMTSIKVAIKVRPLIEREKEENRQSLWTVFDEKTIKTQNKEHVLSFGKFLTVLYANWKFLCHKT